MQLTKFRKNIIFGLILGIFLTSSFFPILAEGLQDEYDQKQTELERLEAEKAELERKIADAQNQVNTLANQISYFNNTIYLTELEINQTQQEIINLQDQLLILEGDIGQLSLKISNLEDGIDDLDRVLKARIRESYELGVSDKPWEFYLLSESLDDLIRRQNYLISLQYEDQKLMHQMRDSQVIFSEQKCQLEEYKSQKEDLKSQLEDQKIYLDSRQQYLNQQKASKEYLLQVTQNDEAQYQEMLLTLEKERQAIREALSDLLQKIASNAISGTAVTQGSIIGLMGNTGMSTGPHLHFEVRTCLYGCVVNPRDYINNGIFIWPFSDFWITQEYGYTQFAATSGIYSNNFHSGIDLVDLAGYGAPVRASADGMVYYDIDKYGGHYAAIRHNENLWSFYWHLQPVVQ